MLFGQVDFGIVHLHESFRMYNPMFGMQSAYNEEIALVRPVSKLSSPVTFLSCILM